MNYRYYFADYENPQLISNMMEYSFVPSGKYPEGAFTQMLQNLYENHAELGDFKSGILLTRNGSEHIGKIKRERDNTVETVGAFICKNTINTGECVVGITVTNKVSDADKELVRYRVEKLLQLFGYHKITFVTD